MKRPTACWMNSWAASPNTEEEVLEEERIERLTGLLEEMVQDNTSLFDVLNRIKSEQEQARAIILQELNQLRAEFAGATSFRALRELCRELVPNITTLRTMLDHNDLSEPAVIRGHLESLMITLESVMERMGAQKIPVDPGVDPFDPARHLCVNLVQPASSPFPDAPARTVVRLLENGYAVGDKVITPAIVEVQAGV
jgi:molecular chaperone GrpE